MKLLTRLLTIILLFSVPIGVFMGALRKPKITEPPYVNIRNEYREQVLNEVRDPYSQFNRDELKYYSQAAAKVEQIKSNRNIATDVYILKKDTQEVISNHQSINEKKETAIVPKESVSKPKNKEVQSKELINPSIPSTQEAVKETMNKAKQGFWSSVKSFFSKKEKPSKEGVVDDGSDSLYQDESTPSVAMPSKAEGTDLSKQALKKEPFVKEPTSDNAHSQKPSQVELPSLGFLSDDILKLDQ